jgi:hypothetical protein
MGAMWRMRSLSRPSMVAAGGEGGGEGEKKGKRAKREGDEINTRSSSAL